MSDEYNVLMSIYQEIGRIADALEKRNKLLEGEKSATHSSINKTGHDVDKFYPPDEKPLPMTEEVLQDLKGVHIQAHTDLSALVVKMGHMKWVPFSLMSNQLLKESPEEVMGTTVDIFLTDKAEKWYHKKAWKPYVEVER